MCNEGLILDQMVNSADRCVLIEIASHAQVLKATLAKLADSEHVDVRCAVGENRNTPVDILWKLARDEHPDVRYSLAENCHIAHEVLRSLTEDDNPYVASRAVRTLDRIAASATTTIVTQAVPMFAFAS